MTIVMVMVMTTTMIMTMMPGIRWWHRQKSYGAGVGEATKPTTTWGAIIIAMMMMRSALMTITMIMIKEMMTKANILHISQTCSFSIFHSEHNSQILFFLKLEKLKVGILLGTSALIYPHTWTCHNTHRC